MTWPAPHRSQRCVWIRLQPGLRLRWAHCCCGWGEAATDPHTLALWHASRCHVVGLRIARAQGRTYSIETGQIG